MGIFGGGYNKPGPGVSKDEPQKKRFFLFFDIYFRKFWKLCQLNFLYILFWIPMAVGVFTFVVGGPNLLSILLMLLSAVGIGPATAGATYVMRNFSREEHAFVFSDFKDALVQNFRRAAIVSTISSVLLVVIGVSVWFYNKMILESTLAIVPVALVLLSGLTVIFVNYYIYTIIVTFEMPLTKMIKNALIFSVVGVFTNLLTTILVGAILVALALFFPITILFIVTMAPATMLFIITFNAYPKIDKFMIQPATAQKEPDESTEKEQGGPGSVFSDDRIIPEDRQ